jgi:spore coat protein H
MKREIRPMKAFSIMIATVCVGVGGLLLAPMVSGQQTRVGVGSSPVLLAQNTPPAPAKPADAPAATKPATPAALVSAIPDLKFQKKDKNRKASDDFFNGPVRKLEFVWDPEEWEYLKRDNRRYAECDIIETLPDGTKKTHKHAAVKLKGAAGSFQGPDQKPGLTISMNKYKGADRFHGMEKFHLNNGAQDGSFLNELVGGEWCRASAVPASRCSHVLVKWNGRDLGLYVFKESFTEDFLTYFYEKSDGSFYDGHFIAEVDGALEKQHGDPKDKSDLKALADACKIGDPKAKWAAVEKVLDVEQYLRALAMETFTCHWDGYNFNRNNYRVYFDPKTGKANFFCHGMDQLFSDASWPVVRDPGSLVGQAVFSNPDWKTRYRVVAEEIYQKILKGRDWEARIAEQGKKVMDALQTENPQMAKDYQGQITAAQQRVMARITAIGKQFGDMPKPFEWTNGVARIGGKKWNGEGGGTLDEVQLEGQRCLHLKADANAAGSWRRTVALEPGRYRLEVMARAANVDGAGDEQGLGLGIRVSGAKRSAGVKGTTAWQKLAYDFESTGADVVLVAELRAAKGEAWFQAETFQIVRLK